MWKPFEMVTLWPQMWNRYSHQNFIFSSSLCCPDLDFVTPHFLSRQPRNFPDTAPDFQKFPDFFGDNFFYQKVQLCFSPMYCKDNSVWELIPQWKEARFRDLPLTANEENKAWKFKTKTDDWYWNCNWLKAKFLNLIWGDHYGKDRAEGWNILWKVTVTHGCPGVF